MGILTGRIYKPERCLYYIIPNDEQIEDYYLGIVPDVLKKYDNAFGTYDSPSLYQIDRFGKKTILLGIEYRPGDDRIHYPLDLDFTLLPASFMIQALFTDSIFERSAIRDNIKHITYSMKDSIFHSKMIAPLENPEVIQISTLHGHNKIIIQADNISKDDFFEPYDLNTKTEQELYEMVYHEPITNHYNWNHIWPIIAGYGLTGIQDFAFVHFDIKDFNAINVVYSHDAGNNALIKIANKMKETDWIYESARCHNDNFAMMIKDMPIEETKQKLTEFFDSISTLDCDPNYHIYYRCGVVPMKHTILLGDRVADAGKHVQRASKKKFETEILFYTDEIDNEIDWASKVKAYLDTAIQNDEFLVYLQPKYDIHTEKIVGAEALVRWMYHKNTFLSPARFVPILETGGLINKIDDIVLEKVCLAIQKWKKQKLPLYPISINLSRTRLGKKNLVEYLTSIVDKYGIEHSLINFELTESAASDDTQNMVNIITDLKERGFTISIDDFGTGYSSLSLLTLLPIDTVKVDKSFVDGILKENNQKELTIIRHIITMAKELNFRCLAEGAEEKIQVDTLREYGCEYIQGYYYSKPLSIDDYVRKVKNQGK